MPGADRARPVRPHMMPPVRAVARHHLVRRHRPRAVHRGGSRAPVACFRTSPRRGGVRQAHMSTPSPDGTYVTVANQNGKLFERILTDYGTNTFTLDTAATLDLANCTTPNGLPCQSAALRPDNAPICPIIESPAASPSSRSAAAACSSSTARRRRWPSSASTTCTIVHGNGCLGAEVAGKMYIDSGGGTTANLLSGRPLRLPGRLRGDQPAEHAAPRWCSARARRVPTRTARR